MSCWVLPHPTSLLPLLRCVLAHMVVSHPHCLLCPPYPGCFSGLCPDLTTLPACVNGSTGELPAYRAGDSAVISFSNSMMSGLLLKKPPRHCDRFPLCVRGGFFCFFHVCLLLQISVLPTDFHVISSENVQGTPSSFHSADCRRSDPASRSHRSPHRSCKQPGWRPALQMPFHA